MGIALVLTAGLVVTVVGLNFVTGSVEFFFGRPRFEILKSRLGRGGFAFGLRWNEDKEPASFNSIRVRLYNPFSKPAMLEVSREFDAQNESFGTDVSLGSTFEKIIDSIDNDDCSIMIEVEARQDGLSQQYDMKGQAFLQAIREAELSAEDFTSKHKLVRPTVYYHTSKRSFISDPLPVDGVHKLKVASNPEFAAEFAGAGAAAGGAAVENFSVKKVWIAPGCIVCDACETIYPEVFDVQENTCLIRPDAPLTDGLRITEAADACPVEVIKFEKA